MIHKYQLNGYNIVLDVNSGAVHVVDELFYHLLDFVSEDNLPEACPQKAIESLAADYPVEDIQESYQ